MDDPAARAERLVGKIETSVGEQQSAALVDAAHAMGRFVEVLTGYGWSAAAARRQAEQWFVAGLEPHGWWDDDDGSEG